MAVTRRDVGVSGSAVASCSEFAIWLSRRTVSSVVGVS